MFPSSAEIEQFISKYRDTEPYKLRLKLGAEFSLFIDQLEARERLSQKLPDWLNKPGIIFPPKANLEQASSTATAKYKSKLKSGALGCDLTLGSGIDAHAMIGDGKMVGLEPNPELASITAYNLQEIWHDPIQIHAQTAEDFLRSNSDHFDWIFVDPSRRDAGKRTYRLEDHFPNLATLGKDILNRTPTLIVKLSPVFDLSAAISQLPNVSELHAVAVHREVKELIVICEKTNPSTSPQIHAVSLDIEGNVLFDYSTESLYTVIQYSAPLTYLYEPHPAIIKAGLHDQQAEELGLFKLSPNSHLYTSECKLSHYPGRTFLVEHISSPYKHVDREKGRAIVSKNFPDSVELIRKKTKLKDDSDFHLIATTLQNKKGVFIYCTCINRV